jgi:hypothetical protein
MPLYEGRHNVVNEIKVDSTVQKAVITGTAGTIKKMAEEVLPILKGNGAVAIDGWYGVDYKALVADLGEELRKAGVKARFVSTNTLALPLDAIKQYKQKFITDDPGFGLVNMDGRFSDVMDKGKAASLKGEIGKEPLVVFGPGAAFPELFSSYGKVFYCDKTRQPLLWQMWDGKLIPFAHEEPDSGYEWKEYYYCDYYLLHFQKEYLTEKMDYYIEAIDSSDLKILPGKAYCEIMRTLLSYPVKEVEIYQPGPWGAYRYKDFWDIKGLECNAWNELAGPELSVLVDIGDGKVLNMPFANLMHYGDLLTGPYLNKTYPHLFPMDVWLDDGYFPEKTPAERISMPIHNHPGTDYVKEHFNEPVGRYETYYIAEAYEGANTWMGFFNDADLEEWERKIRASNNLIPIKDWKEYVCNWKSNVGDLYLIPPGTDHGHGGNQMVLEMDTCPSIAGTEYSFFSYDFARNSWDDTKKTMTGKPLKMHMDHSCDNSKWRREDYVDKKLRAKPEILKWTKEYYIDRYSSVAEMPFDVERLFFYKKAEYSTEGKYAHIITLTVGDNIVIRSKKNPELKTNINLFQSAVIPAAFGDYILENSKGGQCTAVVFHWKDTAGKQ